MTIREPVACFPVTGEESGLTLAGDRLTFPGSCGLIEQSRRRRRFSASNLSRSAVTSSN
ncbi:MAG: hypothetical protein ISS58_05225 [Dehalococcoidales bacterium]|nr:hypothetical protein [Dehalococcoidales bacterium]